MREYSTPIVVDIPPSARLTDIVFGRAASDPAKVVMRRKAGPSLTGVPAAGGTGPGGTVADGTVADGTVADGPWRDVTAAGFAAEVAALGKGLMAAGIGAGDRVALMSCTRYEWTVADYAIWAAGGVTVPVYETSSAEQLEWILTDSGARALIMETTGHLRTAGEVLRRLPDVSLVWLIESAGPLPAGPPGAGHAAADPPGAGHAAAGRAEHGRPPVAQPLSALAAAGAAVPDSEFERRRTSRTAADLATIIYTSGTTGRPKGCELSHANLLADVRNAVHGPLSAIFEVTGASTLLFLPLAHSFARIIQVGCLEAGAILGHIPDVSGLLGDLAAFQPSFILAVPRVFEKVYNAAEQRASASPVRGRIFQAAARTAIEWSRAHGVRGTNAAAGAGDTAPAGGPGPLLRVRHAVFDHLVYAKLRAAVGGRVGYAVSGGAPLGERLGHFFRGAGITILEGYGLTESSAAATVNRPERIKIGTVGQPLPGVSIKITDDGEICLHGPTIFGGYWRNEAATAGTMDGDWLCTGDMGELDDEGYLRVTGRKKELIVTASGKNVAPAVLEDRIRAHPLVSQCMVVGDGRPYVACLITLDEEAMAGWKARHGRPAEATVSGLRADPELIAEIQAAVDDANKAVSRAESIRRFRLLPGDFTEQEGYLTPSLKIRRNVVTKDFADEIEALYT